jgi:hypothetical protein
MTLIYQIKPSSLSPSIYSGDIIDFAVMTSPTPSAATKIPPTSGV